MIAAQSARGEAPVVKYLVNGTLRPTRTDPLTPLLTELR
jgi:hypothetical protein